LCTRHNDQEMQVQNPFQCKTKRIGTLSKKQIIETSKIHGFQTRSCGKINAFVIIQSFMLMIVHRNKSYQDWATCISSILRLTVSKQAVFNRLNQSFANTLKALLTNVISQQSSKQIDVKLFKSFNSVWLQDSTTFHLPDAVVSLFKGNSSGGKQKSLAKLNVLYNISNGSIPVMDLFNFTDNEQKIASIKHPFINKGDLIIRDLGYFVLSVFEQLQNEGVFFLSRLHFGVKLYMPDTIKQVELSKILRGKKQVDIQVLCGKHNKLKARLVAIKLSNEQANNRIRKAKQNRDKRLNHNEEYYKLLEYAIFITNVQNDKWRVKQVAQAYKIRWNIEILFKSWKSGIHIKDMIPDVKTNVYRVECVLYLILIYLSWFQQKIYTQLKFENEILKKGISIIKAVKFVFMRPQLWVTKTKLDPQIYNEIKYFCRYETRHDRINSYQFLFT
jgi:hypothetical protein